MRVKETASGHRNQSRPRLPEPRGSNQSGWERYLPPALGLSKGQPNKSTASPEDKFEKLFAAFVTGVTSCDRTPTPTTANKHAGVSDATESGPISFRMMQFVISRPKTLKNTPANSLVMVTTSSGAFYSRHVADQRKVIKILGQTRK